MFPARKLSFVQHYFQHDISKRSICRQTDYSENEIFVALIYTGLLVSLGVSTNANYSCNSLS